MTDAKTAAAPKKDKPAAEKKDPKPRTIGGFPMNATINLGVNKDGKKFGADNNPKRAGSAAAARFALYKDGQTLEQALKAGVRSDDVAFDMHETRKFIVLSQPK